MVSSTRLRTSSPVLDMVLCFLHRFKGISTLYYFSCIPQVWATPDVGLGFSVYSRTTGNRIEGNVDIHFNHQPCGPTNSWSTLNSLKFFDSSNHWARPEPENERSNELHSISTSRSAHNLCTSRSTSRSTKNLEVCIIMSTSFIRFPTCVTEFSSDSVIYC